MIWIWWIYLLLLSDCKMSPTNISTFRKNPKITLGKLILLIPTLALQVYFLQETHILPRSGKCEKCNNIQTQLEFNRNYIFFRCHQCKTKQSVRKGTILSKSHLSLRRFILICYAFVQFTWTYYQGNWKAVTTFLNWTINM